jgi:hypothetical protein
MDTLGIIKIDVGEGDVSIYLDEYVPIDESNLSLEFARHATKYAYIAMLSSKAEAMWLCAKESRERAEKQMISDLKAAQKITDTTAEAMAELSAAEFRDYELSCKSQHLLLKAVVDAMNARKDMLISLGAHLRAEQDMTGSFIRRDAGQEAKSMLESIRSKRG